MRKNAVIGLMISCILLLGVAQAHAWGSATHAYIDDRLGKQGPVRNLNEIYGGMATDVFNYLFVNLDWLNYLYLETHYEDNIVLWKKANTTLERAVAFGYISHDGVKGADATAHGTYDYGAPDGYVIGKAVVMAQNLNGLLSQLGLAEGTEVSYAGYELCHTFVESAVDLLLARHDTSLGRKIYAASLVRTSEFPDLLVKAYARKFSKAFGLDYSQAVNTIRSAELEFRKNMVSYGLALAQEPDVAEVLLVEQLVALAPAFLAAYGVELPPEADLMGLSTYLIDVAIGLCQDDYLTTVEDTISFVLNNLPHMGRSY